MCCILSLYFLQNNILLKQINSLSIKSVSVLFLSGRGWFIVGRLDLLFFVPTAAAGGLGLIGQTVQELNAEWVVALLGGLVPLAAQLVEHIGLLGRDEIQDLTKVRGVFFQVERVLSQQQGNLKEGLG